MPGGRIDGQEDFKQALTREFAEELPGATIISVEELLGAYRLPKDIDDQSTSLVLMYYSVRANLPEEISLSSEHSSYMWVNTLENLPKGLNPKAEAIIRSKIVYVRK